MSCYAAASSLALPYIPTYMLRKQKESNTGEEQRVKKQK